MTLWIIILFSVMAFLWASVIYLGFRIPHLFTFMSNMGELKQFLCGCFLTFALGGIITLCLNFVNGIICIIYLALFWMAGDFIFWFIQKAFGISFDVYYAGWVAFIGTIISLSIGWYLNFNVWQTNYNLSTNKKVSDLKIAMFADSHLGTTFDAAGFEKHLQKIQAENPDLLVIVGDFVDDDTPKEDMLKATELLGKMKTKYGVYLVFGNHDKGYYGFNGFSAQDLREKLKENNVKLLSDEVVLLNDSFYLIGRKDYSEVQEKRSNRLSMSELTENLDKDKYMIVLDHQPADYENQAKSEVDLVLSGHTHGGQLFPFNQVGKLIGANDMVYGHKKQNKTDFIVTSGISSWAIKFKTGTKSEFVIINVKEK